MRRNTNSESKDAYLEDRLAEADKEKQEGKIHLRSGGAVLATLGTPRPPLL